MKKNYVLPEPFWPTDWMRENDFYFIHPEVQGVRAGRACVQGRGEMIMLGSYSYLGLQGHPRIDEAACKAIEKYGTGCHGSRLVSGTLPLHLELESELAAFKRTESAIVFNSGYSANVCTITALVGRNDYVFCDKLNHASIVDGCLMSGGNHRRFNHNDVAHLRRQLAEVPPNKNKLVVVDAVFSMDGDIVDLPNLSEVCREYDALLMVDEAHAIGVIGKSGRGSDEHFGLESDAADLWMGTLSKAIPSSGGYVATSRAITEVLKNRGRGFIFSGALSPASAAAALEGLRVMQDETWRVKLLHENSERFRAKIQHHGLNTLNSSTAIIPIVIGDTNLVYRNAQYCQRKGIFVQAIPHPVVPRGKERIRCSITTDHTNEDLDYCAETIGHAAKTIGIRSGPEFATEF